MDSYFILKISLYLFVCLKRYPKRAPAITARPSGGDIQPPLAGREGAMIELYYYCDLNSGSLKQAL